MFEPQESAPWYRSQVLKVAVALLVAGVVLVALYRLVGRRYLSGQESHYSELERHRAQQRQQQDAAQPADAADAAQQAAAPAVDPNAQQQQQAAPGAPAGAAVPQGGEASHATAPAPAGGRNYWTDFRGPARDGSYSERAIKVNWPSGGLTPVWKQPVGGGFSSFVVADGVAYTIEQRRSQEVATAYRVTDGRELWANAWSGEFTDSTGDGPRSTPVWDSGRVYALGAQGELRCLDARTGRSIWNKNILSDNGAENLSWGVAATPLIVDDKVVVMAGGTAGKSVVAYNKMTGAPVWRSQNDRASYTSPMLVTLAGKRQILAVTASRMIGLEPADGKLLWSHPWPTQMGINVSQPIVVGPNRVFISAGYGKGASLVELAANGGTLAPRTVWENTNLKTKFNSPVYYNGHVYGLDEGILTCVNVETGERKWKNGRYEYGQVLLASGHLIVTNGETGELSLVKADPSGFNEVAKFAALEGKTWNVPAIAGGKLLVRNGNEMACFDLSS